jgi:hypothetical protein
LSRLLIIIINVKSEETTNRLDGGDDDGGQFGRGTTNTTQIYNINARRGREENKTTTITSEYKELFIVFVLSPLSLFRACISGVYTFDDDAMMQSIDDICMHAVNSTVLNKERRFSLGVLKVVMMMILIVVLLLLCVQLIVSLIDFFQLDFSKMFLIK